MKDTQPIEYPLQTGNTEERSAFSLWIMAVRPRTLSMALAPVAVGACLAGRDAGTINWLAMVAALLGAVFIQAGTNLHRIRPGFV